MSRIHRAIQIIVGAAVFAALYWFLVRNQIVAELVRPSVDSGKLGMATANIVTSLLEVLAAVGGVAIAVFSKFLAYIASALEPLVAGNDGQAGSVETRSTADPKKLTEDLSRLLIQAVIESNPKLTVQLAHRLAGTEFLEMEKDNSDAK